MVSQKKGGGRKTIASLQNLYCMYFIYIDIEIIVNMNKYCIYIYMYEGRCSIPE